MDIFTKIHESIYANLIAGNSYLLILSGLKTTLIITLAGLFSGTILGAFLCAMHYSGGRILKFISKTYIVITRGTPILLLLLLLFYVLWFLCCFFVVVCKNNHKNEKNAINTRFLCCCNF